MNCLINRGTPPSLRTPLYVVLLTTLVSRLLCWPTLIVGKDGPLYINSMKLDATYNVPMPGNVGWVLLGKLFHAFGLSSLNAFTLVAVLVSVAGTAFYFLLAARFLRPWTAACTTLAMALSPVVWYHAETLMSYETWLAVPPAIAYFGVRYWEERRLTLLYASALAAGIGTILRPDMVVFGGLLFVGVLTLGRAPLRAWVVSALICAVCCLLWVSIVATAIGSLHEYLDRVHHQSDFVQTFSARSKGIFEGLARNGSKYALFMAWGGFFVFPFTALGLARFVACRRAHWRGALLLILAVAPTLYFGVWLFMGTAGLILPSMGAAVLLAGYGLEGWISPSRPLAPAWTMAAIAALFAVQFLFAPLLPQRNQRDVIINVTFTKLSAHAIRAGFNDNLADYGIDSSLGNTIRQFKHPEPIPHPAEEDPTMRLENNR